jgi:hypothetical protein
MTRIVLAIMLAFTIQPITADVLLIDEVRQSERMQLPVNGESKADISTKFGSPAKKIAAVGDPPISRWDYAEYSVYFEHDLVLFTVLHSGAVIEKSTEG